jgi:hypothetical protein
MNGVSETQQDNPDSSTEKTGTPPPEAPAPGSNEGSEANRPESPEQEEVPSCESMAVEAVVAGQDAVVAHNIGIVQLLSASPSEESEQPLIEKAPVDPSVELKRLPEPAVDLDQSLVDTWQQRLSQEHLLILTCYDLEVLLTAGTQVAGRFRCVKRLLDLDIDPAHTNHSADGQEIQDEDVTLDTLLHKELPWSSPTLVLATATTRGAQQFVDSITRGLSTSMAVRNRLLQQDRLLMLLTTPEMIPAASYNLPSFPVPFLEPRLNALFPDKAAEWAREIEQQRQASYWGDSEKRFWELFDTYRLRGTLKQAIEQRHRAVERTGQTETGPDKPLICSGADLENTALFLATFFPCLPVENFQDILLKHLGNRTKMVKTTRFVPTEDGEKVVKEEVVEEEQRLADIWCEQYEQIYERCQLVVLPPIRETTVGTTLRSESHGPVIDFELPELREQVRAELFGRHYLTLLQLFTRMREQRVLLDPSPQVMEGALQLLQTMAGVDSHRYGTPVLLEFLDLQTAEPEAESSAVVDPKLVLSRLYLLIRTFLKDPTLKGVVDQFINDLIGKGRHKEALDLVKKLRFATEFDQVYWWKQLLERGNRQAKERTFDEMSAVLLAGGSQLTESLRKIASWLPKQRKEIVVPAQIGSVVGWQGQWKLTAGASSESTVRANSLLLELFVRSIRRSRSRRYGVWPLEDALQNALCDLHKEEGGMPLIEWLFHASFMSSLQTYLPHFLNLIVWTWVLNPVKQYRRVDTAVLERQWKSSLESIPRTLGIKKEPLIPPALQALVLADLALSLHDVDCFSDSGTAPRPLADVVAAVSATVSNSTHRMVRDYWGAMMRLTQCLSNTQRSGRATQEGFEWSRTRLTAQYQSLEELLRLFSERTVQRTTAEKGDAPCDR